MKHAEERKEAGLEKPRSLLEACEILGNCKNFQVRNTSYNDIENGRGRVKKKQIEGWRSLAAS